MRSLSFLNGDKIPALGLGTWKSKPGDVEKAVLSAIRTGYRHIDCAAIYGNEKEIGRAIRRLIEGGEIRREELWITSKLWNNRHGKDQVLPALKKTLSDLQTDYLDLYLIHWPITLKPNVVYPEKGTDFLPPGSIPISDTWAGMEAAQKAGRTKHIGVSNFTVGKLKKLTADALLAPEVNQLEMHPLLAQPDMMAYARQTGLQLTAYSPLGSRDRPAAFKAPGEPDLFQHPVIAGIAANHDAHPAQILIAWAIQRGTSVIPKSVHPDRIRQNFEAASITLTNAEMVAIGALDQDFRYLDGSIWTAGDSPYTLEYLWEQ